MYQITKNNRYTAQGDKWLVLRIADLQVVYVGSYAECYRWVAYQH